MIEVDCCAGRSSMIVLSLCGLGWLWLALTLFFGSLKDGDVLAFDGRPNVYSGNQGVALSVLNKSSAN